MRRKNNVRVSPYRQSGNKSNSATSQKGKSILTTTMNNRMQGNLLSTNNRRRSRSRSVKKENSPPAEFPSDAFSSSDGERNITQALSKLK